MQQAIWADFNGHNYADLAAKYGVSIQQVYAEISQYARHSSSLELLTAVEAVVEAPEHYLALPAHLRSVVVRAVHSQVGRDAAEKLLSLHSDAPLTAAEQPHARPASQAVRHEERSPIRRAFRLASDFVESLLTPH